ncbi:hypothetical protein HDU86_007264 [Geranomyces michiganensis]|nr:hypothetical protein HDU86_007264 [Geranomyces michiganensis]
METDLANSTNSTNCTEYIVALAAADETLSGALDDQAFTFGYNADAVASISDEIEWFFPEEGPGIWTYYYIRGICSATFSISIVLLLYLRIADSVKRLSGRGWWMAGYGATAAVWFLEIFKQLFGVIKMHVTGDDSDVYPEALMTFATAYKTLLDICFSVYSFRIIRAAGSGGPSRKGRRLMTDDTAFLVAYGFRVFLFIATDIIVLITTQMDIDYADLRFSSMTIWACAQTLGVIKPYIICTDMARIRALSEEGERGGGGKSSRGGESTMNEASSKGGAPEPMKVARTTEIDGTA